MFRYLVFYRRGDVGLPSHTIIECIKSLDATYSYKWRNVYSDCAISIWDSGTSGDYLRTLVLEPGTFILGRVISQSSGYPDWHATSLRDSSGAVGLRDQGEWLFENTWGAYVAFSSNPENQGVSVLRDPSGGLPCHHIRWRDIDVFSSNAQLFTSLPQQTFSVNFESVAAAAVLPNVCKAETGLSEVDMVLPGECSFFGETRCREYLWNPVSVAQKRLTLGLEESAALLRETLINVTEALTRPYSKLMHNLGGLDSSILLACLRESRPASSLKCVTHFSDSFRGDERRYTRAMAAHAGTDLIETRLDPARVDLGILNRQELGASPSSVFDCLQMAGNLHGIAQMEQVDAMTYGFGGDSILYHFRGIYPVLDYVACGESFSGLPRAILDAAQHSGWSVARTIFALISERRERAACGPYILDLIPPMPRIPFLNPEVVSVDDLAQKLHPSLSPPSEFPKGKYLQIVTSAFLNIDYHLSIPGQHEVTRICPLLAQPFLELCYRLPTWRQIDGGIDRSLARFAFRNLLPEAIVGRTSKSVPEGVYDQVFDREKKELKEVLLDGLLVGNGILDRPYLEEFFSESLRLAPASKSTILQFYDWEIWANRWLGSGRVAAT